MPSHKAKPGTVYANVLGTSIMSDGTSASIIAPNGSAQANLIRNTLVLSKITPGDVDYIEASATASTLGDSVEVNA